MQNAENDKYVAFICTACHQEIEAPENTVGQQVECPACGAKLVVPDRSQAPTQAQLDAMKSRTIRIELSDL
jgi:DNA-directed RNA polymerase subunit RPC12/RpoP